MPQVETVLVFLAVLLPGVLYFALALRERRHVRSVADFFPLTRFVTADTYSHSTVSNGISLATVILALVNLAPILGISLVVTVASYAASFILLYYLAPSILRRNPENRTVQAFVAEQYGSPTAGRVAVAFTFVGYTAIFSMELLVGVTILEPFVGSNVMAFAAIYLVFIIGYSMVSGYRSLIATERWQFRFIVAAVAMIPAFLAVLAYRTREKVSLTDVTAEVFGSWHASWPFVLGIVAMNLPAAISDSGAWQRLCSTRSEHDARRGLLRAIPMFVVLWGSLILFSCYIALIASKSGAFKPGEQSLMAYLLSSLGQGGAAEMVMLFVLILGLCAAMITTADSLLLAAAQMFVMDFLKVKPTGQPAAGIRTARLALGLIAVLSFTLFAIFRSVGFDVVQLIFAIYGAQLALFPAVAVAVLFPTRLDLRRVPLAAGSSIAAGFVAAWASALYGEFTGHSAWMYNAPVAALVGSGVVFGLLAFPAWGRPAHRAR